MRGRNEAEAVIGRNPDGSQELHGSRQDGPVVNPIAISYPEWVAGKSSGADSPCRHRSRFPDTEL